MIVGRLPENFLIDAAMFQEEGRTYLGCSVPGEPCCDARVIPTVKSRRQRAIDDHHVGLGRPDGNIALYHRVDRAQ
jgi:hypothetical protein